MHRRAFLSTLGLGAAGMVLDPERALWVPGRRTFFDLGPARVMTPSPPVWTSYTVRFPQMPGRAPAYLQQFAQQFAQQLVQTIDRDALALATPRLLRPDGSR